MHQGQLVDENLPWGGCPGNEAGIIRIIVNGKGHLHRDAYFNNVFIRKPACKRQTRAATQWTGLP